MARILFGVSGASGVRLALLAMRELLRLGHELHLVISDDSWLTIAEELGKEFVGYPRWRKVVEEGIDNPLLHCYKPTDFLAPIASGTFLNQGMFILPCSMTTLAAVALGLGDTLLRRAADVVLKERRMLLLLPREMPYSSIHLEHMLKLSRMGASILSPQPSWYLHPQNLQEVEEQIVAKAFDLFGITHSLGKRWGG